MGIPGSSLVLYLLNMVKMTAPSLIQQAKIIVAMVSEIHLMYVNEN